MAGGPRGGIIAVAHLIPLLPPHTAVPTPKAKRGVPAPGKEQKGTHVVSGNQSECPSRIPVLILTVPVAV